MTTIGPTRSKKAYVLGKNGNDCMILRSVWQVKRLGNMYMSFLKALAQRYIVLFLEHMGISLSNVLLKLPRETE